MINIRWKQITALAICVLLMVSLVGCVDQHQQESGSQDQEGQSIISTSISVCEILDALGVDNVVGVPQSSTYAIPDRYQNATKIGAAMTPDKELVSSLNPTLILSPLSLENDLAPQYEELKVDSAFLNLNSVAGMYQSIKELGPIVGKETEADQMVTEFKNFMNAYQNNNQGKAAPRVLILMGLPGSYVVATENSYVGSLVKMAGGINVYGDENSEGFLNVNTEDMVKKQPDLILRTSHAMPEQVKAMFSQEFETNDIWKHFDVVQNGKVYDLDNQKFGMSARLNYQDALKDLQEILYGEQ